MKNYFLVTKLLLKDILRKRDKGAIALFCIVGVLYLFLATFAVIATVLFAPVFMQGGKQAEFITTILFADFFATIILGIIAAISFLYLSKDNQFFLSLPIKPFSVFLSKLTIVYLSELILSLAILAPLLITSGIVMNLPVLFYFFIPIIILTVPVFAMLVIALLSMPIVFIITLFRNKGAVTSIIVISIFAIIMTLYYMFIFSASANAGQTTDFSSAYKTVTNMSYAFFPMYMLTKFACLNNVFSLSLKISLIIEISIFLSFLIAFFVASFLFSYLFYNKINARIMENNSTNSNKKREYGFNTPFKAMIKKEFKEIIRNATVAFQAFGGIIISPLLTIILSVSLSTSFKPILQEMPDINEVVSVMVWSISIIMVLMFSVGINVGANTCISREGEKIQLLKMIPIDYKMQIKAKHTLYIITGALSLISSCIALIIATLSLGIFVWWILLMLFVATSVWIYAMTALTIYLDLKSPKLDWKSIKEILKRGKNSVVSIVWILVTSSIMSLLMFLVIKFFAIAFLFIFLTLAFFMLSGAICCYIFHNLLYKNTNRFFAKIYK